MKPLPVLLSVPHAGWEVPREAKSLCALNDREILEDGDEGARDLYFSLKERVAAFLTTTVARAVVDLNRAEDDRRPDGVVKEATCWNVPVWRAPLPRELVETLLEEHHRPYHGKLARLARGAVLGVDGHTMAPWGPPVGPDPGAERPRACLGYGEGTCPREWVEMLAAGLRRTLGEPVTINDPFSGGFITRSRPGGIPWVQVEISRGPWMSWAEKAQALGEGLEALRGVLNRSAETG